MLKKLLQNKRFLRSSSCFSFQSSSIKECSRSFSSSSSILQRNLRISFSSSISKQIRLISSFSTSYSAHVQERLAQGIVPKPLDASQTTELITLLKNPTKDEEAFLLDLLVNRIPPGVDEAAYIKAGFLTAITKGETSSPLITPEYATELLGTMQGGYNINTLVDLLDSNRLGSIAANGLSKTLLMFESFYDVEKKARNGNVNAQRVLESWANAEWFLNRPVVPQKITVTVFKVFLPSWLFYFSLSFSISSNYIS